MKKVTLGPRALINPKPVLLIGVSVDGKPNFMTAALGMIVDREPPMVGVSIRPGHYSYKGIRQNGTFSVNIPSVKLLYETDYCGIVSGKKVDKASRCDFEIFYGTIKTAPLIGQCPVNLECTVQDEKKLGGHVFIIAKIEETHVSEHCFTDGEPDPNKLNALVFVSGVTGGYRAYHELGPMLSKSHGIGKQLGNKNKDSLS